MECRVRRVEKQKEINKSLLKEAVRTVPQLQDCRRHVETATFLSHHIVSCFISALTPSLLIYVSLSFSSLSLPLLMFYQGVIIHLVYLWLEKVQAAAVHVVYITVEVLPYGGRIAFYCLLVVNKIHPKGRFLPYGMSALLFFLSVAFSFNTLMSDFLRLN